MITLRDRWRDGQTTLGLWASDPSSVAAEALAQTGVEYVCADNQHGLVDYQVTVPMIQAILAGGSCPIVRVPWNEPGIIGKMLDAGAHGIVVPMVNTEAQAQAAVSACRYPPLGARSYGPAAVAPRVPGYFDTSADQIAVIPMVETAEAVENVDAIVGVPGVDAVYVGPSDLSISLGLPPRNNDDEPVFAEALETIVAACDRAGVVAGIHSTGSLTPMRLEMGFRMVTVTSDLIALRLGLAGELKQAREAGPAAGDDSMY